MRFLADESCDYAIVRALRAAGHDVLVVAEAAPGETDDAVLDLARRQERILLTEDKDFGQFVYAEKRGVGGVIFLRYPAKMRADISRAVVNLVGRRGDALTGRFIVVQPGRVRIGRTP